MSKKPVTHWTIEELNKVIARKFRAAGKNPPGPKRQQLLREAKRYQNLLETKKSSLNHLQPTPAEYEHHLIIQKVALPDRPTSR